MTAQARACLHIGIDSATIKTDIHATSDENLPSSSIADEKMDVNVYKIDG